MRRRDFISIVGSAAAWPLTARAQQTARLPTIGFLGASVESAWSAFTTAFVRRLGELGWIEQRTVAIEYRWGQGSTERFAEIATEFVKIRTDVIVTAGSAVPAIKQVISTIPIVFAIATDPVGSGLVESLARPGGNVTGVSDQQVDLAGKRVEILREAIPGLRRLAILANAGYHDSVVELADVDAAARRLGLDAIRLEIRRAEDVAPAFQALKGQADALYVVQDGLVSANYARIVTFMLTARLPAMWPTRAHLQPGGLLSYGPSFPDLFRRAAEITDKILHGVIPADIPVEQPTKFDFVINLTTAKALLTQSGHWLLSTRRGGSTMKWPPLCRSSIAGAERNTANSRHRSDRPFGFGEVERKFRDFEIRRVRSLQRALSLIL